MTSPNGQPLLSPAQAYVNEAEKEKKILASLLVTGPLLIDAREKDEILHLILRGVKQFGFDRVRLYLISPDGRSLIGKAQIGMENQNFVGVRWRVAEDIFLQELVRCQRPRVFTSEPGQPAHSEDRLGKNGVKEWACWPLQRGDRVIGLISADNKFSQAPIHEAELLPLAAFADQAAASIENAQRHSRSLQERLRLIKMYRVITEIFADLRAMDRRERLQLIARRAKEMLNAESCSVLLVKEEGVLTLEACHGHRSGEMNIGRRFEIRRGPGTGLTGHLAFEGKLFNATAEQLAQHPAVKHDPRAGQSASRCQSLLAAPLKRIVESRRQTIGLLEVNNKRNPFSAPDAPPRFTREDEQIISIFAEAVVAVMEADAWGQELTDAKRQKELVVASLPLAVITTDMHGNVVEFNPQAEKIFGYSAADARRKNVSDIYFEPQEARRIGARLKREGPFYGQKTWIKAHDGQLVPISLAVQWLEEGGQPAGVIGFFEDLRSLTNAEKRLEMFLKASEILARECNLDAGLNRLAQEMVSVFPGTFCRILLYDETREFLRTAAAYPLHNSIDAQLQWEPGLNELIAVKDYKGLRELLDAGNARVISHAKEDARPYLAQFNAQRKFNRPINSLLIVPLVIQGRTLGLLNLGEVCQNHFRLENINLVTAIASQISVLIDRIQRLEQSESREALWERLDTASEQLNALTGQPALIEEIPRLAAELMGCQAGGLFALKRRQLELQKAHGIPALPQGDCVAWETGWLGQAWRGTEPRIGLVPQIADSLPAALGTAGFKTVCAIPLRRSSGETIALLLLGDSREQAGFTPTALTFLRRFIAHASLALQTSELLEEGQARINQTSVLHRIRDFIQECDDPDRIFHAVLTGVTAGYGLGFNRALLFLTDATQRVLRGEMGIGQLNASEARSIWESHPDPEPGDCEQYLASLKNSSAELTAAGQITRDLRYSLENESCGLFAEVLKPEFLKKERCRIVPPSQFALLPEDFVRKLAPETDVALVPLIAQGRPMGLLIADNKFTDAPISREKISLLISFANTIASAIDNLNTLRQARETFQSFQQANDKMSRLQQAGGNRKPLESPEQFLRETIALLLNSVRARRISLMTVNASGQLESVMAEPDNLAQKKVVARPDGVSASVLASGQPRFFGNLANHRDELNQILLPPVHAAAVFPLLLPEQRSAVLWIHFTESQEFTEFEKMGLQMFASQFAIAYDHAERIKQMEIVIQTGEELASANTADLPKKIVQGAAKLMHADAAVMLVYDEEGSRFLNDRSARFNLEDDMLRQFLNGPTKAYGTAVRIMQQGHLLIHDIDNPTEAEQLGDRTKQLLRNAGARALHGLALKVGDESLGVLYLIYKQPLALNQEQAIGVQAFANLVTEEKAKQVQAFVNQASLALKKARLADQLDRTHQAMKTLSRVSQLGNRQAMIHSIVSKVKDSLKCGAVVLYECDLEDKLVLATMMGVQNRSDISSQAEEKDVQRIRKLIKAGKPLFIENVPKDQVIGKTRFAQEEKIQSCVIYPLQSAEQEVGVLFINYHKRRRFTQQEQDNIRLLVTQAAASLGFVHFMEEQKRLVTLSNTLLDEIKSNTSLVVDRKKALLDLLKRAVESIAAQHSQRSVIGFPLGQPPAKIIGSIQFYDSEKHALSLYNTYPEEHESKMEEFIGKSWPLDEASAPKGRIGVTGRTVLTRQPQLVPDVDLNSDFLRFHDGTRSALSVPLLMGEKIIGTLNIESNQVNGLDDKDRIILEALANFAVYVIRGEDQYQRELMHTELARIGMASSTWGHTVRTKAQSIKDNAGLLRFELKPQQISEEAQQALNRIERASSEMLDKPITAPLSSEEGVQEESVYALITERIQQVCSSHYPWITYEFHLNCERSATINVSAAWFHRAIDILLDNAARAMEQSGEKRLIVRIYRKVTEVLVVLSDTGTGIPPGLEKSILRGPIEKQEGESGWGIGLLLANMIFKTYGGKLLDPKPNLPTGTKMSFRLPAKYPGATKIAPGN